jgi:hypothetical protein
MIKKNSNKKIRIKIEYKNKIKLTMRGKIEKTI